MALESFDPTSRFDVDMLTRALGGFSESPATARETGLRQRGQEQDLALNFMRQITDLQEMGKQREFGREMEGLQAKGDVLATLDPVARITRLLSQGTSPLGSEMGPLMGLVKEKHGAKGVGTEDRTLGRQVLGHIRTAPRRLQAALQQIRHPGEGAAPEELNRMIQSRQQIYMAEISELQLLAETHPESAAAANETIRLLTNLAAREGLPGFRLVGGAGGGGGASLQPQPRPQQTSASGEGFEDILAALLPGMGPGSTAAASALRQ